MAINIIVASPASPALPTVSIIRASFASPTVPKATFETLAKIGDDDDDDTKNGDHRPAHSWRGDFDCKDNYHQASSSMRREDMSNVRITVAKRPPAFVGRTFRVMTTIIVVPRLSNTRWGLE